MKKGDGGHTSLTAKIRVMYSPCSAVITEPNQSLPEWVSSELIELFACPGRRMLERDLRLEQQPDSPTTALWMVDWWV